MADDVPGVFVNPSLQALHDDFVRRGSLSLVDALTLGAKIEDLDIVDLRLRDCGFTAIDGVSANHE